MAAPNIANVSTIVGKTAYDTPASTSPTVLLANAASSGKVFKINQIVAANVGGVSAYNCSVVVNTAEDGTGTSYAIALSIPVPANASLIVVDKSTAIYLEEGKSIVVTSATSSTITYTVSYEELS